jgi:hypothetical protein
VTNVSTTTGATTIQVCFDKQIASVPDASQIFLGGYRTAPILPGEEHAADSAVRASNQNCADATWSTNDEDVTQRTYVRVGNPGLTTTPSGGAACAVVALSNGQCNLPDSVALNGSSTHNGTRGHSTGPDLEGITINPAGGVAGVVNYVFDQRVGLASNAAGCFAATLQNGTESTNPGGAAPFTPVFSGNVVTVPFAPGQLGGAGNPVVRGTVTPACVFGKRTPIGLEFNISYESANAPGTAGLSNRPDLTDVSLTANNQNVVFTFDESVTPGANFATGFGLTNSDNLTGCALGAPTAAGSQVVIPLTGGCQTIDEYVVWGEVVNNTVVGVTTGNNNVNQGVPAGGNANAFASGFTTGPDAFSVTFNTSNNTAAIRLDQRCGGFSLTGVDLIDDAGALIPGNPTAVAGCGTATPGPATVVAQFPTGAVTGARSVLLEGPEINPPFGAFATFIGYGNVSQVLAPSAVAKRQYRNGHVVRHKATHVRTHRLHRVIRAHRVA